VRDWGEGCEGHWGGRLGEGETRGRLGGGDDFVEEEEGGYVGEGFIGDWLEPFSEEFRGFVEDFFESLGFFGGFWEGRCCVWRDCWLRDCWLRDWSDGMLVGWFWGCVSSDGQ
jgi:hypothetical protein